MDAEIALRQSKLKSADHPARPFANSIKGVVWAMVAIVLAYFAVMEFQRSRDRFNMKKVNKLTDIGLPAAGALYCFVQAKYHYDTPRRLALKQVEEETWERFYDSKMARGEELQSGAHATHPEPKAGG